MSLKPLGPGGASAHGATGGPTRWQAGAATGLLNAVGSIIAVAFFGRMFIRAVGLETYGAWSIVAFLSGLQALFEFGFGRESVLRIALAGDDASRARHVSNLFWYSLGMAVLTALVAAAFLMGGSIGLSPSAGPMFRAVLLATVASAVVLSALCYVRTVAEALHRLALVNLGSLVQTILAYSLAAMAARASPGTSLVYASYPVALTVVLLGMVGFLGEDRKKLRPAMPKLRAIGETFMAGAGHGWAGALSYAVLPLNRTYILRQEASLASFGAFDVLARVAEAATSVLSGAFTSLYRFFLQPQRDAERWRLVQASERAIIAGWLVGSLAYAALAVHVLTYLLGPIGRELAGVSIVMLVLRAVHGVAEPTTRFLWAAGDKRVVLIARISAVTLNLSLLLALGGRIPLAWVAGIAYGAPFVVSAIVILKGARLLAARKGLQGADRHQSGQNASIEV